METLAFIHTAIAHEDPNPDPEVRAFENIDLKVPGSVVMGVLAAGVVTTTLSHADSAQAAIYYGNQGSGVAALQRALGTAADGVYGPQTYNDLIYFQRTAGLQVDGVAGPQTLAALGLDPYLTSGGGDGGPVPVSGGATVVASSGLLIRSSPGGSVIGSLGYGQSVSLSGRESGGWAELASGGWVSSYYLDFGDGGGTVPIGSGAYINAGIGVNVRSGPSIYSAVAYGLGYGDSIALTGATQYGDGYTWSELSDGNWVASQYISYR